MSFFIHPVLIDKYRIYLGTSSVIKPTNLDINYIKNLKNITWALSFIHEGTGYQECGLFPTPKKKV